MTTKRLSGTAKRLNRGMPLGRTCWALRTTKVVASAAIWTKP
jgi:hypothetical protein